MTTERPIRVLLVEDDPDDYALTRAFLAEIGPGRFDLEWATTCEAGLEAMGRGEHDVYLVDYQLGDRTGLELLAEARAAGCTRPVILLTGLGGPDVDLEAMRAGAADFLPKARLDTVCLERSIRYALERWRAHEELEARVRERTAELSRANEALRQADRRKDEFLAMLAHELRNPLAPILNCLDLLEREPDAETAAWARRALGEQARHMARLIDDLLDVARVVQGRMQVRPERLDLAGLVRTTAEGRRGLLERAELMLVIEGPPTPVWVWGDPTRLAQVLTNLLDNAAKFTDPGGLVTVGLAVDKEDERAVLTVRDTGVGIEPEMLGRLWEAFAQADRSLDRSRGGLGLGLTVVKGVVELHGGTAEAHSDGPGKGATFTVRLPVVAAARPAGAGAPAAPVRLGSPDLRGEAATLDGRRLRVLIVEDNQDAANSLKMLLELLGHEVRVAYTGPDGVRIAREWPPELVLCDIGLPGLDGYGVARALRADPATAGARLLACTGYGSDDDRRQAQEAGFDQPHLVKPVAPDALLAALARAGL